MNKAILVIDMPESCDGCDFCYYSDGRVPCCRITFNATANCKCPLKPLPEKYDIEAEKNKPHDRDCDWEFEYGYNQCIDEILGD